MDINYIKTLTDPQKIVEYFKSINMYIRIGNEVPQEIFEQRLNICQSCNYYNNNMCLACGCSLSGNSPYSSKLKMDIMTCSLPNPKWGPYSSGTISV